MAANAGLFFRRWLANPLQMGSLVPSSSALCSRVVRNTRRLPDETVLELGAGTRVISQGRGLLHYSYCATSPLPWRRHRLTARPEAWTPLNFPPASVWRYTPMS